MYQLWYIHLMGRDNDDDNEPILDVVFYKSGAGNEPVREWLKSLPRDDRRTIGEDIKTAQYGWPLGLPLIRKMERGLWDVRSNISTGIARVFFTVKDAMMILLHGFVKKSQKSPPNELDTARRRLNNLEKD
jgi:phage-related protein